MNSQQLELVFDPGANFRPPERSVSRSERARWWFRQMHRIVDAAIEWRPAPPPRPEQKHLRLAA
jgi:hypothetical protein